MGEAKRQEAAQMQAAAVHYDLAQAEAAMRKGIEETVRAGDEAIAEGRAEAAFIAAQRKFDESRIQFVLAGMAAVNDGISRDEMFTAGGMALGLMMGGLMNVCIGNRERNQVDHAFRQAFADCVAQNAASKQTEVKMDPMPAGRA